MYRFELPDIGEGVVEAEVIEWKVTEGGRVELDEVFVELMTDKASIEIPAPRAGRVHRLCYAEGDIVPVGAVLIEIDEGEPASDSTATEHATADSAEASAGSKAPSPPPPSSSPVKESGDRPPAGAAAPPVMPTRPGQRGRTEDGAADVRAVPAVRELAKRLGVELTQVQASGPGGRVMRRDVLRHADAPTQSPPEAPGSEQQRGPGTEGQTPNADERGPEPHERTPDADDRGPDPDDWERVPLRGMRRAIARHMSESRRRAAHFTYVEEIDLTALLHQRDRAQRDQNLELLSPLAFIARATLRALPDFPMLNASIDDTREEVVVKKSIHLGVAVTVADALVVPVIRDAPHLSTIGLAHEINQLAARAREGQLRPDELRGSTFTITSLGKLGGIASTPILNHPEVGILSVNAVRDLPRYIEGALQPRSIMNLSISVDHRIADGFVAASFIAELKRILESAEFPDLFSA